MSFQDKNYILGFPKLPQRALIFLVPSGIVSFISTVKALGFSWLLVSPWLTSWGISWAIAFPTVLFVLPFARKLSLLLVRSS